MKKTDKKIENSLRQSLTEVCEVALYEVAEFKWLTHLVDYRDFPGSLSIVCVFETDDGLSRALDAGQGEYLRRLIKEQLTATGIALKDIRSQVRFDTEEACDRQNGGKWSERLK